MAVALPLSEPTSIDYVYVDKNNKVHLLLPIVGGDTIGLDNTCKTAMELQTFFYGRAETHEHPRIKSAKEILEDLQIALESDIQILSDHNDLPELLDIKLHRLTQVQGFLSILRQVKNKFVEPADPFPEIPAGVQELLKKKSNALSIHLNPKHVDHLLRTQSPVFSLARPKVVKRGGYYVEQPTDAHRGLGPSLRRRLPSALSAAKMDGAINDKEKLIAQTITSFPVLPRFDALISFLTTKLLEKFGPPVDLTLTTRGEPLNESYFSEILSVPYATLTTEQATTAILNSALSDEFWASHKQCSIFTPNPRATDEEETERFSIAIQFFLANINIYCHSQQLSGINFGEIFDTARYREEITLRINHAIAHHASLEDVLFDIVNGMKTPLKLSRTLTEEDKEKIKTTFTMHYNLIKESPHFDEFVFFIPDHRGDFFNHRNRISIHFLDLIKESQLPARTRARIDEIVAAHELADNLQALKAAPERRLSIENPTRFFHLFLNSIDETNVRQRATQLSKKIQDANGNLLKMFTFDELESLMQHSYWGRIEAFIRELPDLNLRRMTIKAIDEAKQWLSMTREKMIRPTIGPFDKSLIIDPIHWQSSIRALRETIRSYTGKLFFRYKSDLRKEQVRTLQHVLSDLEGLTETPMNADRRTQALHNALKSLTTIIESIAQERVRYKRSGFLGKLMALKTHLLDQFTLQNTAIGIHPLDPIAWLTEQENLWLGDLSKYTHLHALNATWWSEASLAIIKALPTRYYTESAVNALNRLDPATIDADILKVLQTDPINLEQPIDIEQLKLRGRFLHQIGDELPYSLLSDLNSSWWKDEYVESLKTLCPSNYSQGLIELLNSLSPQDMNGDAWRALQTEKQPFGASLTLETLQRRGQFLNILEAKQLSPLLKQTLKELKQPWWAPSALDQLLTLPTNALTPSVIGFLNTKRPEQINEDVLNGLRYKASDKTLEKKPLTLNSLMRDGQRFRILNPTRISLGEVATGSPEETIRQKIISTQQRYAKHVHDQFHFFGFFKRTGDDKNKIIQTELNKALQQLTPNTLQEVKQIIQTTKEFLETQYGKTAYTWSFFHITTTLSTSSRLLGELINAINLLEKTPSQMGAIKTAVN